MFYHKNSKITFKQVQYIRQLQDLVDSLDKVVEIRKNSKTSGKAIEDLSMKAADRLIKALLTYHSTGKIQPTRKEKESDILTSLKRLQKKLREDNRRGQMDRTDK